MTAGRRRAAVGRGARGGVSLHLVYEARDASPEAGEPARWRITLKKY
ncbi:MAG TPA: hypothetical protein VF570_22315 [Pyrinomonadaceae bacterium]